MTPDTASTTADLATPTTAIPDADSIAADESTPVVEIAPTPADALASATPTSEPSEWAPSEELRSVNANYESERAPTQPLYVPLHDPSLLRNPFVLAGSAVLGAILLAVAVVIFLGTRGGGGAPGETERRSNTPVSAPGGVVITSTARPSSALLVRSIASGTVHSGPDFDYGEIGPLRSGAEFTVLGRNPDSTWFQIQFPPGSSFTGWIPATALPVPQARIASLPITESTPIPRPTFAIPTAAPVIPTRVPVVEPTTAPVTGLTPTVAPVQGFDISASAVAGTCAVGSRLRVAVTNNGPGAIEGRAVAILTQNAQGVQQSIVSQVVTLAVGQSVSIDTGYTVEERVVSVVDPLGTLGDVSVGNNRVDCVVGAVSTPRPVTATPVVVIPTIAPTTAAPVPTATAPVVLPTVAPTTPPIPTIAVGQ